MNIENAARNFACISALSRNKPINNDIGTIVEIDNQGNKRIYSAVNYENHQGYIPVVSMKIGVFRIAKKLLEIIMNIGRVITLQLTPLVAIKNICNNVAQIVRGAVEIVPIIGNLIVYAVDKIRIKIIEGQINQKLQTADEAIRVYYANGKQIYKLISQDEITYSYEYDFSCLCQLGVRFH